MVDKLWDYIASKLVELGNYLPEELDDKLIAAASRFADNDQARDRDNHSEVGRHFKEVVKQDFNCRDIRAQETTNKIGHEKQCFGF